jgi:HAD superfamily hydrolase (TIGR01509 family)
MYRAILFDIDGTLVESNDAHARAWSKALSDNGYHVPFARVRSYIGMGSDKLLFAVAGVDSESDVGRRIKSRRREVFDRLAPSLQATRGARELLQRLLDDGMTLALATSAEKDEAERLLRASSLSEFFDRPPRPAPAQRSKPDPDVVKAALQQTGVAAHEAVLIGDTPYDIEAARRSGLETVALRCGGWWSDAALGGALAIYDDPRDLFEQIADSPLDAERIRQTLR